MKQSLYCPECGDDDFIIPDAYDSDEYYQGYAVEVECCTCHHAYIRQG